MNIACIRWLKVSVLACALMSVCSLLLGESLPQDKGAVGTWQKLAKLQTTASLMQTMAHPDDEHGGLLAWLSRGKGVRVALTSLTRGEAGDNAIGPELFDGLGLIRTEELRVANRFYGVDKQYYTTAVDYGFSKRLDEALEKWGTEEIVRDLVHIIRVNRPFVLISRFQGNLRDGHGHHQAAGLISREAFEAAGDRSRFPEQLVQGLRPWQPLKLYIGGVREDEDWTIRVDTGEYSPWLGASYESFARIGLSYQRSQNSGRRSPISGPFYRYYKRIDGEPTEEGVKESDFFDGIDVSIPGMFEVLGSPQPAAAAALLDAIDASAKEAARAFRIDDPSAAVPALVRGLDATRDAMEELFSESDIVFMLRIKERQFMDVINTALGIELEAVALPARASAERQAFSRPLTMGPVVPGQRFHIRCDITNRSEVEILLEKIQLEVPADWEVDTDNAEESAIGLNETASQWFDVRLPDHARVWRPHFTRDSIQENRYSTDEPGRFYLPMPFPAATSLARYTINGVSVEAREVVRRRETNLPYGYEMRELAVVPAIVVNVEPRSVIVPLAAADKRTLVQVELENNRAAEVRGEVMLELPLGWSSTPTVHTFRFSRDGEKSGFTFSVSSPKLEDREYRIQAVAKMDGREFRQGYDVIRHRDLETRYLYHDAVSHLRGVDVEVSPNLTVGYVMGIGDQVPSGIAQLGASVRLLGDSDLAAGDLQSFDAIMTGTRAYAVRKDLTTYNQRLLDYVRQGGNLIVLYNTAEFVPTSYAPFPAQLPRRAEEVTEEDSPVEILTPEAAIFNWPNRITIADFDGWVEQRGSKFWSEWDPAYTAMLATHDEAQELQRGGWLWARYGEGHYTYFAYALHRQLPYGVPGAFRLLANLLSLGKEK